MGGTVLQIYKTRVPSYHPAALERWVMDLEQRSAHRSANPDKQVINIAGDGCFRMNMNEIATAAREKLPLIQKSSINNHVLGMVRQWQDLIL